MLSTGPSPDPSPPSSTAAPSPPGPDLVVPPAAPAEPAVSRVEAPVRTPEPPAPDAAAAELGFRGRFVNDATGAPIPHLGVVATTEQTPRDWRASTDDEGRFELVDLPPGPWTLWWHEPGELGKHDVDRLEMFGAVRHLEIEHVRDAPDVTLEIPVGPTYGLDLRFTPAPDVGAWPPGLECGDFLASLESEEGDSLTLKAPRLREGPDGPWVRFTDPIDEDVPARLKVRDGKGEWAGSAAVASTAGIQPERASVELASCGSIGVRVYLPSGRVMDQDGLFLGPEATVYLEPLSASGPLAEAAAGVMRDRRGSLPPGTYTVRAEGKRYASETKTVSVLPGERTDVELQLEVPATSGTVSGRIRSTSGTYRPRWLSVSLEDGEAPPAGLPNLAEFTDIPEWDEVGGEVVGAFAFEDVPEGTYELSVYSRDNYRWSPGTLTVTVPAEGLEFVCDDAARTHALTFEVAGPQGTIEDYLAFVGWAATPEGPFEPLETDRTSGHYEGVSDGSLRWFIIAEGTRAAGGDETAFEDAGDGHLRVARLQLDAGWSRMLMIMGPVDGIPVPRPVAGARAWVDGEPYGDPSNPQGILVLDLPAAPSSLEVVKDGCLPATVPTSGEGPLQFVELERE